MNIHSYFDRIRYEGSFQPAFETLDKLHTAHMFAVPFENLDIPLHRRIILDESSLFNKIVTRRRGGFCYELNGLFAALLRDLGFNVTMLAAGVARERGGFGPEFDHMALIVTLGSRWLVDVGFGDSFLTPLLLDDESEQKQDSGIFKTIRNGKYHVLLRNNKTNGWAPQYRFTLEPRQLNDYNEQCRWHQTSPGSSFTQKRVCSLPTNEGRITLSDSMLITTTHDGSRQKNNISTPEEYLSILREKFGIILY